MVFMGPGAAQSVAPTAAADEITWVEIPDDELTVPYDVDLWFLTIHLQAATPDLFMPLWYQLLVGGMVYETVYLDQYIYDIVYYDVDAAVYDLVYFVYSDLFISRTPFQLAVWYDDVLLRSVSIVFEGPPPEDPPGPTPWPGPGVGVPAPPPVVPGQPIVVTPTVVDGNATAVVDSGSVQSQLQAEPQANVVSLKVPATAGVTQLAVQLPTAVVNNLADAKRGINIETQFGTFLLPAGFLAAPEVINQMVPGARLELAVRAIPAAQADAQLAARPAGASPVGQVVEITMSVVNPAGASTAISTFAQRVWVSLPFEAARLGAAPAWSLGVYRLDEATNTWEFRGGKVNLAAGTVSAGLNAFSKFTVMAYHRTFADIRTHWSQQDVEIMASRHVARGIDQNRFEPDRNTTRSEFAALLLRSMGVAATRPARATFNDVAADKWYFAEVETARRVGLVIGYEDNTFRPEQRITRQEIAAMVNRAMGIAGKPVTMTDAEVNTLLARFADATSIAPWARHAAAAAVKAEIVKGRTATTLAPVAFGTRAEGTVMLKRMLVGLGEI
jgi:hypothetical protein